MRISIFLILAILFCNAVYAQEMDVLPPPSKKAVVEITGYDFTRIDSFNANKARVLGLALGMSISQAEKEISYERRVYIEQDKLNGYRRYIYYACMRDNDTADVTLGYLKWNEGDTGLAEIVIYESIWQLVTWPKNFCDIFSGDALDPDSKIYKNFFGKPSKVIVDLDIPSIELKTTEYYYPAHNMVITKKEDDGEISYTLTLVRKME